jgi:hypothetical protein
MYPTLISEEIREVFADVRDDAKVQDKSGTEAVNYCYANGSFTSQWSNSSGSGKRFVHLFIGAARTNFPSIRMAASMAFIRFRRLVRASSHQ